MLIACGDDGGSATSAGGTAAATTTAPAVSVTTVKQTSGDGYYTSDYGSSATTRAATGAGVDAAKIGSADAHLAGLVTYNGHLLYYFAGDKASGDANGVWIPAWYLLDANGDKVG